MPRQSIGDRPMTDAERQARYRAARAADTPAIRSCRPTDRRSRARRWARHNRRARRPARRIYRLGRRNAYDSATAEALQTICDLDLGELQAIEPPRGFGRD
jgi:hypothetical protein